MMTWDCPFYNFRGPNESLFLVKSELNSSHGFLSFVILKRLCRHVLFCTLLVPFSSIILICNRTGVSVLDCR